MVRKTGSNRDGEDPRVTAYIDGVLDGSIVVGRYVRLAVERHVLDLDTGHERGLWFDTREATFALKALEFLKHSKGEWAGRVFRHEPWQAFLTWSIFGWRRANGYRRFRTAFIKVARKNGKTFLAAAWEIKLLALDNEPGAEVYTFATKRDQAKICHDEVKRMVRASDELKQVVHVLRDRLTVEATNSICTPLSADYDTLDGLNVHGAVGDEVHAHPSRDLWDVIETATGARRQPLLIGITTAGKAVPKESIYTEHCDYSRKVLDGIIADDTWFAALYELDRPRDGEDGEEIPGDDWNDEACWIKANPNLGVSVRLDELRERHKKAIESPGATVNFRVKRLNEDLSVAESWLRSGLWQANAGGDWYGSHGLRPEVRERWRGRRAFAGLDLASVSDLAALVVAIPDDDGAVDVLPFAWCPRDNAIGRQRDDRVPYVAWSETGQLALTEGDSIDYDVIRATLQRVRDEWGIDIVEVTADPWNARHILQQLADEDGFVVSEHRQGYVSMHAPIQATEKLLLDKKLRHGGHRPLAWCVDNVVIKSDPAGNKKFDKAKSREKIDLAVALAMAVGRAVASRDAGEHVPAVFYPGSEA